MEDDVRPTIFWMSWKGKNPLIAITVINNCAFMLGNKMKLITLFTASYNGAELSTVWSLLVNNAINNDFTGN